MFQRSSIDKLRQIIILPFFGKRRDDGRFGDWRSSLIPQFYLLSGGICRRNFACRERAKSATLRRPELNRKRRCCLLFVRSRSCRLVVSVAWPCCWGRSRAARCGTPRSGIRTSLRDERARDIDSAALGPRADRAESRSKSQYEWKSVMPPASRIPHPVS